MNQRTQILWKKYRAEIDMRNEEIEKENSAIWDWHHKRMEPQEVSFFGFTRKVRVDARIRLMHLRCLQSRLRDYKKPSMEDFLDWCETNKFVL